MNPIEKEAVDMLSRYLRIDTTNPPGNEVRGAEFFADIFEHAGISYKTYEPKPGRTSLRGVIPGNGEKKPVILLNHMDVVPADAAEWQFDPFGGEVRDGFIHGRGAIDMKGQGIMELVAMLNLKRQGITPCRDIIFMAVADEEMGGRKGVKYLLDHHGEDFEADLVINEGGYGLTGLIQDRTVWTISAAEKGVCWLKLIRTGPPGHGSLPHGNNALEKLIGALNRVLAKTAPVVVTPIISEYFTAMGRGWDFLEPFIEDQDPATLERLLSETGLLEMHQISAMLQNTVSLTTLHAGNKTNTIPSRAEATLDIRLLPAQSAAAFIADIKKDLDDDVVEIEVMTADESTESSRENESFRFLSGFLARQFPDDIVVPSLLFGASDSRFFRDKGIPAYGFCPMRLNLGDVKMIHGIDERISVENMINGTRVFIDLVEKLAAE